MQWTVRHHRKGLVTFHNEIHQQKRGENTTCMEIRLPKGARNRCKKGKLGAKLNPILVEFRVDV
jgi:hypothetical protein